LVGKDRQLLLRFKRKEKEGLKRLTSLAGKECHFLVRFRRIQKEAYKDIEARY